MWNEPALTIGPLNYHLRRMFLPLIVPYSALVVSVVKVPDPTREACTSDLVYWLIPCEVNRPEAFTVPLTRYNPSLTRHTSTPKGVSPSMQPGISSPRNLLYPSQRVHLLP